MPDIATLLHPAHYQGRTRSSPYFEGWYFKIVDRAEARRFAIIPAVFLTESGEGPHAFIQVFDGVQGKMTYIAYPLRDFWAAPERFEIHLGPNVFTAQGMHLDIRHPDLTLQGEVQFLDPRPWPVTLFSPGIMGWFAWAPFMECYHGVLSLDHGLTGQLVRNGETLDFTDGRGYIEKDWGRAFPSAWVWMQTNHFDTPGVALTGSIAMIPWIGQAFRGFILGLWHNQTLYRFATYTGARTEYLHIGPDSVSWGVTDRLYYLTLNARRSAAVDLRGPSAAGMGVRVPETLTAAIHVRLATLRGDRLIFEGVGRNAGLEVAGNLATLQGASTGAQM